MKTIIEEIKALKFKRTTSDLKLGFNVGVDSVIKVLQSHQSEVLKKDEINFLLTLIEMNGQGKMYAFPGWEETKAKLEGML